MDDEMRRVLERLAEGPANEVELAASQATLMEMARRFYAYSLVGTSDWTILDYGIDALRAPSS